MTHRLTSWISDGVDRCIPAHVHSGDPDVFRRCRLVVAFTLILSVLSILYVACFIWMNSPMSAFALILAIASALIILYIIRRTGSYLLTGNLLAAVYFGCVTVLVCRSGGHGAPTLTWYTGVPIVALCTAGRRSSIFWFTVTVLSLSVFYALDYEGYSLPNDLVIHHHELFHLLALVGLIVLMLGLAFMYEAAKIQMLRQVGEGEERMELALRGADLGTWDWDLRTDKVIYNKRWAEMKGYRIEEIEPHLSSWKNLVHPDDLPRVYELLNTHFAGQTPFYEAELRMRHRSGQWLWILDRGKVIERDADGQPVRACGTHLDVTDSKNADERMRELATVTEQAVEGIAIANLEGYIQYANQAWVVMHGYDSAQGLVGKHLSIFHTDQQLNSDIIPFNEKVINRGYNTGEVGHQRKDGTTFPTMMAVVLLKDIQGKPYGLASFAQDITQRKQAEEELLGSNVMMAEALEREKLTSMQLEATMKLLEAAKRDVEAASQSKSDFLANMSHEIRTPMTAILGYSELVAESLNCCTRCPGHPVCDFRSTNREYMQTIRRNGEHLLQIINDILDISKVEAGKLEVERIRCSSVQLVVDVKSLMQVRANARRLTFDIEYDGAIPETIRSDPTRLKQILVNLIGNAIKFTEEGGVRLVCRCVGQGSNKPMMQFDVIDTGIGMTTEQVSRLFQAFTQGDASTTRQFGGTGLGLTISQRLAEMLGGSITVDSKPGEGSTFRVTIATGPLENVRILDDPLGATLIAPTERHPEESQPAMLDCRILLAEDGPDNQRLITYVLKKAGAKVTIVENGKLAVETALAAFGEGNPFDVILMDMQMPVMDGYEATNMLRRRGYTDPIIALTAHAMARDQQKCLDAGCDDYATKPIDRRKLIETIHKHIGQKSSSTIDWRNSTDVLASDLADDPGMAELIEMFVAELPDRISALEKALAEQDHQMLASLAHQLKGAAGGHGFPSITQAAKELEMSAMAQVDIGRLRQDLDSLADLCRYAQTKATAG